MVTVTVGNDPSGHDSGHIWYTLKWKLQWLTSSHTYNNCWKLPPWACYTGHTCHLKCLRCGTSHFQHRLPPFSHRLVSC